MPGKILALGGLSPDYNDEALHRFVAASAGKDRPKVCWIGAANGDYELYKGFFYEQYPAEVCEATHINLYRNITPHPELVLAEQDVIYVAGGSTPILIAALRALGLDVALRAAWERGATLAGDSAGAHAWFEGCVTDSSGQVLQPYAEGLSILPGSIAAHFSVGRHRVLAGGLDSGTLPGPGWGVADGAALVFQGTEFVEAVSSRVNGGAWLLDEAGAHELPVRRLMR